MKKKISVGAFLIFTFMLLFQTDNCFATNVFTDIRLRDLNRSHLVIDLYAFSDDVNIYGVLGTLEYDTNLLSLISCTGMDDFNVVYSDNKILADDYRKHNNFFSFATCTFDVKNSGKSLKSTTIEFKNINYSDYEQTYFMKDANLKVDLSKSGSPLVSKNSINIGGFIHTYLPTILLAIILGIQVVVISFLIKKNKRRKNKNLPIENTVSDTSIPTNIPQNNYFDNTLGIHQQAITQQVSDVNQAIDFNQPVDVNQKMDEPFNVSSFDNHLSTVEFNQNNDTVDPVIPEDTLNLQESVTEVVHEPLSESIIDQSVSIPDSVVSIPDYSEIDTSLENNVSNYSINSDEIKPEIVDIEPIMIQDTQSDVIQIQDESIEEEPIKIIPAEEDIQEEKIVMIPEEDFVEQEKIITIPTEEAIEENVISIPDEEGNPTYSSNPSYSTSQAFQFITGNDTNKF